MTRSRKLVVGALVVVGAVAVAAVALYQTYGRRRPARPIDAVPPDAFVAVDVDLDALRRSGALAALFGSGDEQTITRLCGFDPVDRIHDLVLAFPEKGDGDFGVAVQADLSKDELLGCAQKVIQSRGGDTTADVATRGSFSVVSQRPGTDHKVRPSLAYREGGPYLVGVGDWLAKMIDAVDRPHGPAPDDPHLTLRKSLAGSGIGPAYALSATVVLPKSVRERVKTQMDADESPSSSAGAATMDAILGVSSAAVGLLEHEDQIQGVVALTCEDKAECAAVQKLLWKKQEIWSKDMRLRVIGVAAVLDHMEVEAHDARLEIRVSAPTSQVVQWGKSLLEPKPISRPRAGVPPGHSAPASSTSPPTRPPPP